MHRNKPTLPRRHGTLTRRTLLCAAPGVAALGVPTWTGAATGPGISATEILIGQTLTLQGGRNAYGVEVQAGVRAAVEAANRSGGVNGRRLVLQTLDDGNDPAKAEANARQLAGQGVFVLFGSIEGNPSAAVMNAAVQTSTPFFGPMAGAPVLRRPHQPLVFPVRAEHRDEFKALMEQGRRIGLRRVALFHSDTTVGREHLANVEKLALSIGLEFGGGVPFKSDITDDNLTGVAAQLQRQGVDLLLNHGSAGVYGRLVRAARRSGLRLSIWGVNSGSSPLAAELGPLAHGMIFSQVVPHPNSGKTALAREYQARLEALAPGTARTYGGLEGFMTAKALLVALQAAGPNPTRQSLLAGAETVDVDLGGVQLRWRPGDHAGCSFVDLALVGRDGRFVQ